VRFDHLNGVNEVGRQTCNSDFPPVQTRIITSAKDIIGRIREETHDPPKLTGMTSEEGWCNGQKKTKMRELA
jgi:hypothetical protein